MSDSNKNNEIKTLQFFHFDTKTNIIINAENEVIVKKVNEHNYIYVDPQSDEYITSAECVGRFDVEKWRNETSYSYHSFSSKEDALKEFKEKCIQHINERLKRITEESNKSIEALK